MKKSNGWTIFWLIAFFPFGLYRMWRYKQFPKVVRIIITAVIALGVIGNALSSNDTTEPASATPKQETQKVEIQSKEETQKQAEADAKKKAKEEAKKKAEAEAAAKKKAEEEALAKKKAEEEAKKIKPGIYEIGKDIQPGLYKSYDSISYWARLSGFSGELNEILANGNPVASDIVEVLASDKAFQSEGSGYWLKIDDTYKPQMLTTFGDGMYIVGKDIAPGRYKSSGGSGGYWARLKGFSGDLNNILANANVDGPTIVEIKPTDKGFQTSNNGTWTKVQ